MAGSPQHTAAQEDLLNVWQRRQRHRAQHLLALRHVPPAEDLQPAPLCLLLNGLRTERTPGAVKWRCSLNGLVVTVAAAYPLDLLGLFWHVRQEEHRDAARLGRLALQLALVLEQLPRHGHHHARAVT